MHEQAARPVQNGLAPDLARSHIGATEPFPGDGVDAEGGPWRCDPWGRTLSPTIAAAGPPDGAGSDRHGHLWRRRTSLTSARANASRRATSTSARSTSDWGAVPAAYRAFAAMSNARR